MKKLALFLMAVVLVGALIPVSAAAWDVDEVYEHNQRVRAQWVEREMCEGLRASYLLPVMNSADFFNPSVRNYIATEFPDEIIYTANNIIDGIYGDFEKARAIANWVSRNISYGLDNVIILPGTRHHTDALNVLEARTSVCAGFSNLTVALLRSVGVPAKRVSGPVWGDWGRGLEMLDSHAWIEAFVSDRWIIVDPTWMTTNRSRYFDISLREVSRSHRYEERFILVPHSINGLIFDSRTNHLFDLAMDTSTITEFIVPEAVTVLNSIVSFSKDTPCLFPNLERLILPDGLISISGHLFGHSNLQDVKLPESLELIGDFAFQETSISEITLPNRLERIGAYAFANTPLTNITLPDGLQALGLNAFANTNLKNIIIPNSLERINAGTFENANLYSAYIPASTTTIIEGAFANNPHLTIFGHTGSTAEDFAYNNDIPFVAVQNFEVVDNFAMNGDTLLFPMFDRDKGEIALPEGITEIAKNAFRHFENLTELNIPEGVTSIGESAFANTGIEAVFLPPTVTYIGSNAFENGVAIYGHLGTAAEGFAQEHGNEFVNATALGVPVVEAVAPVYEVQEVSEAAFGFSYTVLVVIGIGALLAVIIGFVVRARKRS